MKKLALKDRYVVEDGIPTIRQINHEGKPMPTFKERDTLLTNFDNEYGDLLKLINRSNQDRSFDR